MHEANAFASQFASTQHRDHTAELGMWVFIATEVLLFGGLVLAYFVYRHAYSASFLAAGRQTHLLIGTANTAILLTSSFLVAWAVETYGAEARRYCPALLAGAIILGLVFIVLKGIEYKSEYDEHLVPGIDFKFDGPLANG